LIFINFFYLYNLNLTICEIPLLDILWTSMRSDIDWDFITTLFKLLRIVAPQRFSASINRKEVTFWQRTVHVAFWVYICALLFRNIWAVIRSNVLCGVLVQRVTWVFCVFISFEYFYVQILFFSHERNICAILTCAILREKVWAS